MVVVVVDDVLLWTVSCVRTNLRYDSSFFDLTMTMVRTKKVDDLDEEPTTKLLLCCGKRIYDDDRDDDDDDDGRLFDI